MMPDLRNVQTPVYICDRGRLEDNLKILAGVARQAECKILMALKGFAMFSLFPQIQRHLHGLSTSSLDEALLAYEEFEGGEIHVYAPAYCDQDFSKLLGIADHLVFNSFSQWRRFRELVKNSGKKVSCGIRINPEHREVKVALYDPCAPYSRLGVTRANFEPEQLEGIDGLHFHTLCELNSDALLRTVAAVEDKFGAWLPGMKWVNFGGGHHITRPDYDRPLLCEIIRKFKEKYRVEVYLEPGEAVALNIGVLVASVLDIIKNGMDIAILDTSAAASPVNYRTLTASAA
jgi:carboxynorspermidine decarboxylase